MKDQNVQPSSLIQNQKRGDLDHLDETLQELDFTEEKKEIKAAEKDEKKN